MSQRSSLIRKYRGRIDRVLTASHTRVGFEGGPVHIAGFAEAFPAKVVGKSRAYTIDQSLILIAAIDKWSMERFILDTSILGHFMLDKLLKHIDDYKGWDGMGMHHPNLIDGIVGEASEFKRCGGSFRNTMFEAADIANYAMMIYDNALDWTDGRG